MVSLENLTGMTGILLDAAVQAAETAERGPGTSLMPVAAGLIAALALMVFLCAESPIPAAMPCGLERGFPSCCVQPAIPALFSLYRYVCAA